MHRTAHGSCIAPRVLSRNDQETGPRKSSISRTGLVTLGFWKRGQTTPPAWPTTSNTTRLAGSRRKPTWRSTRSSASRAASRTRRAICTYRARYYDPHLGQFASEDPDDLARFRIRSNLTGSDTFARVEINGRRYCGVNSAAQPAETLALRREFLPKIQTQLGKFQGKQLNRVRALRHA